MSSSAAISFMRFALRQQTQHLALPGRELALAASAGE
jgi:hypothetical protein